MFEKMNITPLMYEILLLLGRNPDKELFIREIARTLDRSAGGCHRALKDLEQLCLITARISGKNTYYQINNEDPSVKHYKIFSNILETKQLLTHVFPHTLKVILFGSLSKGTDTQDSDIDILIVTLEPKKINTLLKKLSPSRPLNPQVFTPTQLLGLKTTDKAFYNEIVQGVVIWEGVEDEDVQ